MKKFLAVIALVLVALMIATPVVGAEEIEDVYTGTMTLPNTTIRYATNVSGNAPVIDGEISDGEYGPAIRIETPRATKNEDYGVSWETNPVDETLASEYIDFYFAYDEDSIYIAVYDAGPEYIDDGDEFKMDNIAYRSNYRFQLGFDLADVTSYFQFEGYRTDAQWPTLSYFEFGSKKTAPIKTYDLISEAIIQKKNDDTGDIVAFGDLVSANGNANYTDSNWSLIAEFKLDKEIIADSMNTTYYTDYETISDAMWFTFTTAAYRAEGSYGDDGKTESYSPAVGQYFRWLGQTDITDRQGEYADFGLYEGASRDWFFDLVVFAEEGEDVRIANAFPTRPEPEETEPVVEDTEDAADATEPVADATEPTGDVTEPASGGCGGAVSFAGIALVAALGTCTAFVAKKKED